MKNGAIIQKINILLLLIRLKTRNSDHECNREIFTKVKVHTFLHNLTSFCNQMSRPLLAIRKKCMLVARWFRNWIYGSESHMLLYNYATSLSAHYPTHTL